MTIAAVLLGIALLIVVVLFIARPLLTAVPHIDSSVNGGHELKQQKEHLLAEIGSLDFDYETGKIPQDVYELQRAHLMQDTADVLKRLDELSLDSNEALRKEIEAAVALRRHKPAPATNGQGKYCHNCGQHLDPGDKFCANCGQAVRVIQPTV